MILKKRNWKKLVHRFYPLLLVSVGLHGLVLLMPLSPKPEPIVEAFKPEPKPIQVSVLPKKDPPEAAFSPAPAPPTPPPPAEAIPAQPMPQIAAQPPVTTPVPQPAPVPNSMPTTPTDAAVAAAAAAAAQLAESTTPQAFVPPDADFATTAQQTAGFTQNVLANYTNQLASGDSPPELKNIGKGFFGLNYTGDRCFQNKSSVEGSLAVVIDSNLSLVEGEIIVGTGYEMVNQAIDTWFSQLAGSPSTADSNIEVVDKDLFAWIDEKKKPLFAQGESYEAYIFKTTVNLVNNTCL